MREDPNQQKTPRSTLAAFVHASPAIGLMALLLWVFILAIAWTMGTFLGGSIWIIAVVGGLCAIPGLWLTWQMVKLAIEAERYPDS